MNFSVGEYVQLLLPSKEDKRNIEEYGFITELHTSGTCDVKIQISNEIRKNVPFNLMKITPYSSCAKIYKTRSQKILDQNIDHSPSKKKPKLPTYADDKNQYVSSLLNSMSWNNEDIMIHPLVSYILNGKEYEKGWLLKKHKLSVEQNQCDLSISKKKLLQKNLLL